MRSNPPARLLAATMLVLVFAAGCAWWKQAVTIALTEVQAQCIIAKADFPDTQVARDCDVVQELIPLMNVILSEVRKQQAAKLARQAELFEIGAGTFDAARKPPPGAGKGAPAVPDAGLDGWVLPPARDASGGR